MIKGSLSIVGVKKIMEFFKGGCKFMQPPLVYRCSCN